MLKSKKVLSIGLAAILLVSIGIGTWALVASGQPALPTAADGSIPIPNEMLEEFKKTTGEDFGKLNEEIKAIQERQKTMENFYIQVRMNTLKAAQIPVNQYQVWRIDFDKKALVKVDPKTGMPVAK